MEGNSVPFQGPVAKQVTESPSEWRAREKMLVANVQADHGSVEKWYALLNAEEEHSEAVDGPNETLLRLYAQATTVLPCGVNVDNELYLRIWIGYAKQQMKVSVVDALETFKLLESRNIGNRFALRFTEWAKVEVHAGYRTKALQVIRKGFTLGAMPTSELHRQYLSLHPPEKAKADVVTGRRSHQTGSPLGIEHRGSTAGKHDVITTSRATHSSSSMTGSSSDSGTQDTVTNLPQPSNALAKEEGNGHLEPFAQRQQKLRIRSISLGPPVRVPQAQTGGTEAAESSAIVGDSAAFSTLELLQRDLRSSLLSPPDVLDEVRKRKAETSPSQENTSGLLNDGILAGEASPIISGMSGDRPPSSTEVVQDEASPLRDEGNLPERLSKVQNGKDQFRSAALPPGGSSIDSLYALQERLLSFKKQVGIGGSPAEENVIRERPIKENPDRVEGSANISFLSNGASSVALSNKAIVAEDQIRQSENINQRSSELRIFREKAEAEAGGPSWQSSAGFHGTGHNATRQPLKDINVNKPEVKAGGGSQPRKQRENKNFVVVNNKRYQKLRKIGRGGSSEVFQVADPDSVIFALKRIDLKGKDHMSACSFYQEIEYLEKLRNKRHIVQMIDYEVTNKSVLERRTSIGSKIREDCTIYMVLEHGEIDFAGMLAEKRKTTADRTQILDENWLRLYWQHLLEAVDTIHKERIVHSDLKPPNFLLVKGELKLIDFGIANAIQNDTTNIVKENHLGTLHYMAPEALLQNTINERGELIKVGRASDIWSLGCILYEMVYGRTPFSHLIPCLKAPEIVNPNHKINFPAISNYWLMDAMKKCLCWDPHKRLRIPELLAHPFLRPVQHVPREPNGGELQPQDVEQLIVEVQGITVDDVFEFKSHVLMLLHRKMSGLLGA